ncbi:MAG: hypothetical protein SH817_08255 [Leptospira sp.]|nr:hypothetical protein [Leptospira sp.]
MLSLKNTPLLLFLLIFDSFCNQSQDLESPVLLTKGVQIEQSFPIKEIFIRGRVVRQSKKNLYSLAFDSNYTEQILKYKPSKIQVKLPYNNSPTFLVNLNYINNEIKNNFNFPKGWIDSSDLEAYFYINNSQGWNVPFDSIYSPFGDEKYIIKLVDGKALRIPINIIRLYKNSVVISGNIEMGDILINSRLGEIVDGMKIKVKL